MADPITRSTLVPADPATAFRIWVEEIDGWWPKSHSLSKDPATRIVIETHQGGRFYEHTSDGAESDFGSVLTYDPPHRLVYHWFLGTDVDHPTVVDVTFEPAPGGGGTRVTVEHSAAKAGIEAWTRRKGGYERAWADVLPCYESVFK